MSVRLRPTILLLALLGQVPVAAAVADEDRPSPARHPFPLDLAFGARTIYAYEKAAVSPSGAHLAYGVTTPARHPDDVLTLASGLPVMMHGVRLHVVRLDSGRDLALGHDGASSFGPAWSPDGRKLAYYSDQGGRLRLWILDVATGDAHPAADVRIKVYHYGTPLVMPPTWSPDGQSVLVPALPGDEANADPRPAIGAGQARESSGKQANDTPVGVRVLTSDSASHPSSAQPREVGDHFDSGVDVTTITVPDAGGPGTARVVLPANVRGGHEPAAMACFSPSGRILAYVSRLRRAAGLKAEFVADLGVLAAGRTEPLHVEVVAPTYHGREAFSGDHLGRSGVILAWHPTRDILLFMNNHRLRRLDLSAEGKPRVTTLAPELGRLNGGYLAFTPDGARVLIGVLPSEASGDSPRIRALGLVPLDGGPARVIPLPADFGAGQVIRRDRVRLWQPVADTATFLDTATDPARTIIRRVDLSRGEWTTLRSEPAAIEFQGMSRDGAVLVGTTKSYARPPDLFRLSKELAPEERVSNVEPRLEGHVVGEAETFRTVVPMHDGQLKQARTAVLLPPGARRGDRLPAVVSIYGGYDSSRGIQEYAGGYVATVPAQVLTTRGYAVLLADAPLGPDGQAGNPVDELRDVIVPQVYHAAERGYIDIRRVAVAGQSYGGYSTAALVSATNLFRAAIAVAGTYDLVGMYGLLNADGSNGWVVWAEKDQGRMGQPPWTDLRRYLDNSPYARADRIRTPLLLIHGRADATCPVHESEKMFSALRRLGRTAELAVYEHEGHVIWDWSPQHAIDATERMLEFLRRHLTTDPPAPSTR